MSVKQLTEQHLEFLSCTGLSECTLVKIPHCWKSHVAAHLFPYGKCSKILNTFLYLFSNKMLVFRSGIHKMLVRKENGEDPDQTSEAV